MQTYIEQIQSYIESLPEERKESYIKLYGICNETLPTLGFTLCMQYKIPSRSISHKRYPDGYHCDPALPLPFLSLANQKWSINLYHMWIYAQPDLHEWFINERPHHSQRRIDMWKSCIRFKHMEHIPYDLIQELLTRMTAQDRIQLYEQNIKK